MSLYSLNLGAHWKSKFMRDYTSLHSKYTIYNIIKLNYDIIKCVWITQ